MNTIRRIQGGEAFLITQLSMARTFLDMAQLASTPEVSARNLHFATTALAAVREAVAGDAVDSRQAQAIEARAKAMQACVAMLAAPLSSQWASAPDGQARAG
jgi:hypothetical protein